MSIKHFVDAFVWFRILKRIYVYIIPCRYSLEQMKFDLQWDERWIEHWSDHYKTPTSGLETKIISAFHEILSVGMEVCWNT